LGGDICNVHVCDRGRWQAKTGFAPKSSLTRLQLAELLLEHYPKERVEAPELLDLAIAEFRNMKMQPSLERALRHKDILKA